MNEVPVRRQFPLYLDEKLIRRIREEKLETGKYYSQIVEEILRAKFKM